MKAAPVASEPGTREPLVPISLTMHGKVLARLDPASRRLWLHNPKPLFGVKSASLAPGRVAVHMGRQ